jgi:phospholipid transport system substrate-binding protein
MIGRRKFLLLAGTIVSATTMGSGNGVRYAFAADLAGDAERFIQSMADAAIVELTDPEIDRTERKVRMRGLMRDYFFVPGIAQWVLGRFWRKATREEQQEFLVLFEDLLVETYVDKFSTYSGETLKIVKSDVRNGKDVIVTSSLDRPESTKEIKLDWRVRVQGDAYKVIDIMVEGVSMGQTQRAQFASAMKKNDDDMAKFLDELRSRVTIADSGT